MRSFDTLAEAGAERGVLLGPIGKPPQFFERHLDDTDYLGVTLTLGEGDDLHRVVADVYGCGLLSHGKLSSTDCGPAGPPRQY